MNDYTIHGFLAVHMINVQHIIDAKRKLGIDIEMLSVTNAEILLMELFSECVVAEKQQYSVELTLNILLKCIDRYWTSSMSCLSIMYWCIVDVQVSWIGVLCLLF